MPAMQRPILLVLMALKLKKAFQDMLQQLGLGQTETVCNRAYVYRRCVVLSKTICLAGFFALDLLVSGRG